mmetsp:Transcript_2524/g.5431  ORF Transcript_2524/g.5431 Transcript_2524/m.5431 type:complete len:849 (+) Transcript_2524:32-2578(+)|eukprot:CAMPEP_0171345792 /NCGR_PEP_ID=MMETSP0878-20121228/22562_1 /TAXON_ID=67004 /ORGANISM="Thalassiosira weissflogii, Strain CCMP1336" /LENGTH=848 /DNA_ID=CAMNT_0011849299 /DNA_START=15 /DNA_END=2561 /DNA_ORIENTATION=-
MAPQHHSPLSCLKDIGIIDASCFISCDALHEEFAIIKKTAKDLFLATHPDKGGDPAAFRVAHAAFQVLKSLYNNHRVLNGSYANYFANDKGDGTADGGSDDLDDLYSHFATSEEVPSYEHFEEAAREEVPGYRVELAKSGRAQCVVCKRDGAKEPIAKGDVRVGSLDENSGAYGRWHHLRCWKVPRKIFTGFTDIEDADVTLRDLKSMEEVLLCGISELDSNAQSDVLQHVMEIANWVGSRKRKTDAVAQLPGNMSAKASTTKKPATSASQLTAAPAGQIPHHSTFVPMHLSEVESADKSSLVGRCFVVTGYFPEVGGGTGPDVSVEIVKELIKTFGGKVIKTLSKNVEFLVVGKNPPTRPFNAAITKGVKPITLTTLKQMILGRISIDRAKNLPTPSFSSFADDAYLPGGRFASESMATNTSSTIKPVCSSGVSAASSIHGRAAFAPRSNQAYMQPAAVPSAPGHRQMVPHNNPSAPATSANSIVPINGEKVRFEIPRPGVNGAVPNVLAGKKFVLTGIFPEVGGGSGLDLGKERTKQMIESFGGRVTTGVSGKTNFVVVGKEPGASKVRQARERDIPLIDLISLRRLLLGQQQLEDVKNQPPPRITSFSSGYMGNALLTNDPHEDEAPSAATTTSKKPPSKKAASTSKPSAASSSTSLVHPPRPATSSAPTSIVPSKGGKTRFEIPRPGVNGAIPNVLAGRVFVLTGIFPEVGGGSGLNLGKDRTKAMIESFGGRVTSAVSGKTSEFATFFILMIASLTLSLLIGFVDVIGFVVPIHVLDFVLIGKEPGASKVGKAREKDIPLLDLMSLRRLMLGQQELEDVKNQPPPRITSFSNGYMGNALLTYR